MPHSQLSILILAGLIMYLVIQKSKDTVKPLKKLLFLPAVSLYFLYSNIHAHFDLTPIGMAALATGLAAGAAIAAVALTGTQVKADKDQMLIFVQGSWAAVGMFTIILIAKVATGYLVKTNPTLGMQHSAPQLMLLLAVSAASGLPVGQSLIYFMKFQGARSETLEAPRG